MYSRTSCRTPEVVTTLTSASVKTRSAAWPRTADSRTLASAATAATGLSPGIEIARGLGLAHSPRLQVARDARTEPSEQLPAQLDRQLLRLAERDQQSRQLPVPRHEDQLV